jgi:hypothetical protein
VDVGYVYSHPMGSVSKPVLGGEDLHLGSLASVTFENRIWLLNLQILRSIARFRSRLTPSA